jgi:HNH endonuclease/AP2 domain
LEDELTCNSPFTSHCSSHHAGAEIVEITVKIPTWLERPAVWVVLLYRRLRYGYAFRRIPLTKGKYAIVDPDDYQRLSEHKWHLTKNTHTFYAKRNPSKGKGTAPIYMHRCVMEVPPGMVVDHINHDGLDNRKTNLRPATRAQNNRHTKKVDTKAGSRYKGVYYDRRDRVWYAKITSNGKTTRLGSFKDEIEAAETYDRAAKKYHGQFAGLNFPE